MVALIAVILLLAIVGAIGGGVVLLIMHAFHLIDIVHLTYWQAIGVSFLLSGAGSAGNILRAGTPDPPQRAVRPFGS